MRQLPPRPSDELLKEIAWHQDQARKLVIGALGILFVFEPDDAVSDDCKYAMLTREVYRLVAKELLVPVFRASFTRLIKRTCQEMGAVAYTYCGHTMFRGIRRADICEAQSKEETKQIRAAAQYTNRHQPRELGSVEISGAAKTKLGNWEKLLRSEGMPEELESLLPVDAQRAEINAARINTAAEAYWRVMRDAQILRLYIEGKSIIATAERLKLGRKLVWNRLKHYDLSMSADTKKSKDDE